MPAPIDAARTALLLLDYQHDNIAATPGIAQTRVLENSARVLAAARRRGPGAEIHPLVAPRDDELVINKTCVDPFLTNLGQALINFDVNTLILMGLWTNFVVEATARHVADVGYRVIVVRECCASNDADNHEWAMTRILPAIAEVRPLDDVLGALA